MCDVFGRVGPECEVGVGVLMDSYPCFTRQIVFRKDRMKREMLEVISTKNAAPETINHAMYKLALAFKNKYPEIERVNVRVEESLDINSQAVTLIIAEASATTQRKVKITGMVSEEDAFEGYGEIAMRSLLKDLYAEHPTVSDVRITINIEGIVK